MVISTIPNTQIKPSSLHGMGLFATHCFKANRLMGVVQGCKMTLDEYAALRHEYAEHATFFLERYRIDEHHVGVVPFRCSYGFINHHETGNIHTRVVDDKLYVYAARDIQPGEEIVDQYNLATHIDVLGGFADTTR